MKRRESDIPKTNSTESSADSIRANSEAVWLTTEIAMCIETGNHLDLERWKVYRVVDGVEALRIEMVRFIDKSGGDNLYPANFSCP